MFKGGTNFRKASGKRFKKRKCPRRSSLTTSTNESEVETININETADNNHEEDGEISGPSTALPTVPVSEKKLAGTTEKMSDIDSEKEHLTGYRFIDLAVLANVFSLVACPTCGHKLTLTETKKQGMPFELNAVCNPGEGCQWKHTFWTSRKKKKYRSFDVKDDRFMQCVESINTGKILDLEVMSPYCQYCVNIEVYMKDGIVLYDKLKVGIR